MTIVHANSFRIPLNACRFGIIEVPKSNISSRTLKLTIMNLWYVIAIVQNRKWSAQCPPIIMRTALVNRFDTTRLTITALIASPFRTDNDGHVSCHKQFFISANILREWGRRSIDGKAFDWFLPRKWYFAIALHLRVKIKQIAHRRCTAIGTCPQSLSRRRWAI